MLARYCQFILCDRRIDPGWLDDWYEGIAGSGVVWEVESVCDDVRKTIECGCIPVLQGTITIIVVEFGLATVKS